jgi:glycosyltransferase involved in cell wall biosynthesis
MAKIVLDGRMFTTKNGTGAGRYMNRLVHHLQKLDTANDYIVLLKEQDAKDWQPESANFKVVITKYKEFSFGEQIGFAWQLYRLKADLVHFGMTQQPILYFKRSVTTIHDLTTLRFINPTKNIVIFNIKRLVYGFVIFWVAHKNKLIITPSDYVKKDLINYSKINKNKVIKIFESADEITTPDEPIKELIGKEFIMYVGRPQPHKNLGRLIKAYAMLKQRRPNLKLVIAGKKDKMHDKHLQTAQKYGVQDGVVITGFVSEGQLKWLYKNTAVYVFPSLSEGFGLPGLEAMAHGAPVASSNGTCLPEVYQDAVIYFDPKSSKDMAQKIDSILSDSSLRQKLKNKSLRHYKKYSWEQMSEQTLKVYEQALGM